MKAFLSFFILIASFQASAQGKTQSNMSSFLKSCAYGTLGGAALGLGTLAISENPSGKMSNVARGASLGLYAGIAYGFYSIGQKREQRTDVDLGQDSSLIIAPTFAQSKVEGAQVHWLALSF